MRVGRWVGYSILMMCCLVAAGKDKKKKVLLPDEVLEARTVLVVVDPDAGVSVDDPYANRKAQEDVEKALLNWGRFTMAMSEADADLIISVRKGNGRIAQPTIGGVPANNRPVILEPTDSGVWAGGHKGTPADASDPTGSQPQSSGPRMEAGQADDMFAVYRGRRHDALDSAAVWRFSGRDVLRAPGVQAVEAFRRLIAEAEKQKAATP